MAPGCNSVEGAKTMQAQQRDIINFQVGAILKMLTTSGVHLLNVFLTVKRDSLMKIENALIFNLEEFRLYLTTLAFRSFVFRFFCISQ